MQNYYGTGDDDLLIFIRRLSPMVREVLGQNMHLSQSLPLEAMTELFF